MAIRLLLVVAVSSLASVFPANLTYAADIISAERIKADVIFLASDRLEGRGPGTRGEILATEYLALAGRVGVATNDKLIGPNAFHLKPVPC